MFHPVHYSLVLNLAILLGSGVLAWVFAQPILFVCGVMLMNHMVGRFEPDDGRGDPDDEEGQPMGFTAQLD